LDLNAVFWVSFCPTRPAAKSTVVVVGGVLVVDVAVVLDVWPDEVSEPLCLAEEPAFVSAPVSCVDGPCVVDGP
jgi:hypothetical protein